MNPHLQALEQAEECFQQHQFKEGAHMVRQAAYGAIAAAAAANGVTLACDNDAYDFASWMDTAEPDNPYHYWLYLTYANDYVNQAKTHGSDASWQWEADDYTNNLPGIKRMVAQLTRKRSTAHAR